YFEKQHSLKKKVQSTLAYPSILSVLIVAVLIFMLVFIVPQFEGIFASLGGELPAITLFILSISDFMQQFWWLILLVFALIIGILLFFYKTSTAFHYSVHVALLKMPIFGKLLQK